MIFSSIKTRINLLTFTILIIASIFVVFFVNHLQKKSALVTAEEKALILLQHNLAIHFYFNQELKPQIFSLTAAIKEPDYFDPACMSSTYAVRHIDRFYRQESGGHYYYKEAAIHARSPENEADDFERDFILQLNNDQNVKTLSGVRNFAGKPYFFTLIRGERMGEGCMHCHSTPDKAPVALIRQYGATRSFNRSVNEVVSAISIRMPLEQAYHNANALSFKLSAGILLLLLGAFALNNRLINRLLLIPLDHFRSQAESISSHPEELGTTIPPVYTREMNENSRFLQQNVVPAQGGD